MYSSVFSAMQLFLLTMQLSENAFFILFLYSMQDGKSTGAILINTEI